MKALSKPPLPSKQYTRDAQWFVRHYRSLSRKYTNKWVAVHKGRVVAFGNESGQVKRQAQQQTGFLDIPVQLVDDGAILCGVTRVPSA